MNFFNKKYAKIPEIQPVNFKPISTLGNTLGEFENIFKALLKSAGRRPSGDNLGNEVTTSVNLQNK